MKFSHTIFVNLPIDKFIEKFDNAENMKQWQPDLVSFDHLSGTPGEVGAVSKLSYIMGKRSIELIETITVKDLPHTFSGTYSSQSVVNTIENHFKPTSDNRTEWTANYEFQFSGFMKLLGWLMPGVFKKQSCKFMDNFKVFAEKGLV